MIHGICFFCLLCLMPLSKKLLGVSPWIKREFFSHLSHSLPVHAVSAGWICWEGKLPQGRMCLTGESGHCKYWERDETSKGWHKGNSGTWWGKQVMFLGADNMVWSCTWIGWPQHRKSLKGLQAERKPRRGCPLGCMLVMPFVLSLLATHKLSCFKRCF